MPVSKTNAPLRSPRRTAHMIEHLPHSMHELLAVSRPVKLTKVDTTDGAKNVNLTEWLWENCQDQAEQALHTGFIQGIRCGLLDPNDYGGYTVQDAVYCHNATEYLKIALERSAGDPTLTSFLEARIKSYTGYTEELFQQWHIADPSGIAMGKAVSWYSSFERNVAETMQPFYLLIAMLPCEKLWEWLAEQIKSGIRDTNVYSSWITGNLGGDSKLATFVNDNAEKYGVDPLKASEVYSSAMQGEVKFFSSATSNDPHQYPPEPYVSSCTLV